MSGSGRLKRKRANRLAARHEGHEGGGHRCHYCHRVVNPGKSTIDHVVPRALGGPNSWWNRVVACAACNTAKGDRTYEDFTGRPQLPGQMRAQGFDTTADVLAWVGRRP